jgi:hypothetical protein
MHKRSVVAVVLLTALGAGTASTLPAGLVAGAAAVAEDPAAAWNRTKVQRLADKDARSEVQVAAWNALLNGDSAITAFLAPGGGFDKAKARAAASAARNADVIRRVLLTTTPRSSPAVYAAASRASRGTPADQDTFVRTGWDLALAQDANSDDHHDVEVARQAQVDRDYVAGLAVTDPGAWVRAAARRATGGDAELAEFFGYEWASAARGDEQAYRVRVADQDLLWQARLNQLIQSARDAEAAFGRAEAAAAEKARATAVLAWQAVAGHATTAQQGWDAESASAAGQARSWNAVAEFALTATTAQDWQAVSGNAGSAGTAWADEREWAEAQARQWKNLVDSAHAGETRVATTS